MTDYTCVSCGRTGLEKTEIVYKENKKHEPILRTVMCAKCGLTQLYPKFMKIVKPGHEKDMERLLIDVIARHEYNWKKPRRIIERATTKEE